MLDITRKVKLEFNWNTSIVKSSELLQHGHDVFAAGDFGIGSVKLTFRIRQ